MHLHPIRHGVVDSTSERAFAALAEGSAHHGDVHLASAQTAGRGRLGRRWHSAPGEGLYLSAIVLATGAPRPNLPIALTVAGGLAALDAVRAAGVTAATLKWPNDVLVDGAKLCGVLVESRSREAERPAFVLGIGLNVAQREFPPELLAERSVTSLRLLGCQIDLAAIETLLLRALAARLEVARAPDKEAELFAAFADELGLLGRAVRLETPNERLVGRLLALDADGALLEGIDGLRRRIALGHVSALAPWN